MLNNETRPKETMTKRERVMRAVNHEPVDRMPIDLGMHSSTRISAFAYWNLREYLGLPNDRVEIIDMVQFTARVQEDVLERFHCDCIALHPGWTNEVRWSPRGKYNFIIPQSGQPVLDKEGNWIVENKHGKMRMPPNGFFFDGSWLDVDDRPMDEILRLTALEAERIYKDTDYYTCYRGFRSFCSEDIEWQCRMITDPDEIIEEQERNLEESLKLVGKVIDLMGEHIQAISLAGDLGTQKGPMVRPSLYEELCAPYLKKFCDFVHRNSDYKIFLHTCGSIKAFIPSFIDSGIDIINPVQISAENMDAAELKREYGDKITFWGGGCDTQNVLSRGTPEEVAENVKKLVNIFKQGSGYVFNQVHNIMGDVKPENIVAMFDTAYKES